MPIVGEMLIPVSPATEWRCRRSALRSVKRPLIKPKVLCTSCRNLVGAPVANEPHAALTAPPVDESAQDGVEHYGCRICRARLAREKESHDFGVRWRLI